MFRSHFRRRDASIGQRPMQGIALLLVARQHVRVFTLVDVYSRECVALEVARSFSGTDVARLLSDAGESAGGLPAIVQCDNGTQLTSTALDHWACWNRVQRAFRLPGKSVDNSV